jgi:antitoxin component HigA of HigAB toxin-antitoxin module
MNRQTIKTEKEYKEALTRIEELFNILPGDPNEEEFVFFAGLLKNMKMKTIR